MHLQRAGGSVACSMIKVSRRLDAWGWRMLDLQPSGRLIISQPRLRQTLLAAQPFAIPLPYDSHLSHMTHTQSSICTGTMCEARVSRSVSAAAVVPESGRAFGIAISALRCVARRVPVVLASPVTVRRRARVQTKHSLAIRIC